MKKILGLVAILILLGCDDGDMTVQTFNFGDSQVSPCEDGPIYKINGNEVLVLNLAETNFINAETNGVPRVVTIAATGANTVQFYRYAAEVNPSAVCNPTLAQPPIETWIASGGTIEIETFVNTNEDDPTIITGYTHTITIVSLSLSRNDETIILQGTDFGDYTTSLEYTFNFNSNGLAVDRCLTTNTDRLYITNQREVLRMDLDPALFQNVIPVPTEPIVQALDENNSIQFDIYSNSSYTPSLHICDPTNDAVPLNPHKVASWKAVSGSVKITTTSPTEGQFNHQIELINVTFQNVHSPQEVFTRNSYILPAYIVTP